MNASLDLNDLGLAELSADEVAAVNGGISWGSAMMWAGGVAVGVACMSLAPVAGVVAGAVYAAECLIISEGFD